METKDTETPAQAQPNFVEGLGEVSAAVASTQPNPAEEQTEPTKPGVKAMLYHYVDVLTIPFAGLIGVGLVFYFGSIRTLIGLFVAYVILNEIRTITMGKLIDKRLQDFDTLLMISNMATNRAMTATGRALNEVHRESQLALAAVESLATDLGLIKKSGRGTNFDNLPKN